jgi:SAM-dependent methyltransferase
VVDIRNARGIIGQVAARLDAFNHRHPWNHNDHFHAWILRRLPAGRDRALDAGCGRGQLVARLAARYGQVHGVDADARMAEASAQRFAADPAVTIRQLPFEAVTGQYDVITMVAVLHHLDLGTALRHAQGLLPGGGRLLVVGLARASTVRDLAWDLISGVLNPVVGLVKHPRSERDGRRQPAFPVRDPDLTFDEIRAVATRALPGARLRRRLFFRYTLEWTKPAAG